MSFAADPKPGDTIAHPTKQHFVYANLRADIITCALPPGTRLRIDELAVRFNVSIIPVREALRLLESEGLVVNVPHVGVTVSPVEASGLSEALAIMEGLEIVSTRAAADRATEADLAELSARVESMDRALAEARAQDWVDENRAFHLAITQVAAMPLLGDMLARAFDRWERVWRHHYDSVATRRRPQAQIEHHEMVQHIGTRDYRALEEIVRRHNRDALSAYLNR
jgi:DNA-binding GntR family transcriptional regulator